MECAVFENASERCIKSKIKNSKTLPEKSHFIMNTLQNREVESLSPQVNHGGKSACEQGRVQLWPKRDMQSPLVSSSDEHHPLRITASSSRLLSSPRYAEQHVKGKGCSTARERNGRNLNGDAWGGREGGRQGNASECKGKKMLLMMHWARFPQVVPDAKEHEAT